MGFLGTLCIQCPWVQNEMMGVTLDTPDIESDRRKFVQVNKGFFSRRKNMYRPYTKWLCFLFLVWSSFFFVLPGCGVQTTPRPSLSQQNLNIVSMPRIEGTIEVNIADDFERKTSWYDFYFRERLTQTLFKLDVSPELAVRVVNGGAATRHITLKDLRTGDYVSLAGQQNLPSARSLKSKYPQIPVFKVASARFDVLTAHAHSELWNSRYGLSHLFRPAPLNYTQTYAPFNLVPSSPYMNLKAPIKRTLALVIVNLKDKPAFITDRKKIELLAITKNNQVYDKATHGLIQFDADLDKDGKSDIFGPYTLKDDSSVSCLKHYVRWQNEALAMAKAQGNDLQKYNHILFLFPNLGNCKWAGYASFGTPTGKGPYRSYVRTDGSEPRVLTHELGHNLGFRHSSVDPDNDGKHSSADHGQEYGDRSCLMGSQLRNFNAPHLLQMNAFDRYKARVVRFTGGTKRFKIYPLYNDPTQTTGPMVVHFPYRGTQRTYFLSYKTGQHYDKGMSSQYKNGVTIHTQSARHLSNTLFVKALKDGEIFTDRDGLQIRQIGKGPNDAFVEVEVSEPPTDPKCVHNPPVLSLVKKHIQVGANDVAHVYINIENKDSVECGSTYFSIVPHLPSGYTSPYPPRRLLGDYVAPGQKRRISMQVRHDQKSRTVTLRLTLKDAMWSRHADQHATVTIEVDTTLPTRPYPLTGVFTSPTTIDLSWQPSQHPSLKEYIIYRQIDGGEPLWFTTVQATEHVLKNTHIPFGTQTVGYYVVAISQFRNRSIPSNTVLLKVGTSKPPSAPLGLTARLSQSTKEARLEWKPPTDHGMGVKNYTIYHQEGGAPNFKKVATTSDASTLRFTVRSLSTGKHAFYVRAVDTKGQESASSNIERLNSADQTPPTAPANFKVVLIHQKDAQLKWDVSTDKDSGILKYAVYRRVHKTGAFKVVASPTTNEHTEYSIPFGTVEYYVAAIDRANNISTPSQTQSVVRKDATPPTAPSALKAKLVGADAQLSWTAAVDSESGIKEYLIFKKEPQGGSFKLAGTSSTTTFTDANIARGRSVYHIKAKNNAGGLSNPSNDATVERTGTSEPYVEPVTEPSIDGGSTSEPNSEPSGPDTPSIEQPSVEQAPSESSQPDTTPSVEKDPVIEQPTPPKGCGCTTRLETSNEPFSLAWFVLLVLPWIVRKKRAV